MHPTDSSSARLVAGLEGVRGIVFDVDGVLCERDLPIGRAADTISRIAAAGVPFRLLTNNTSKSRRLLAKNLRGIGFPVDAEQIFAPPYAAGEYLRGKKASAFLLVQDGSIEDFEGVDQQESEADCVVVGDLGNDWTFEMLNRAFRILHRGDAELIGLGRTRYWEAPTGLQLDAGPFVAALEYAAAIEALVFGKPEPAIFEAAIHDLGLPAGSIAMIGDDIRSDVAAAMGVGMRGVLVRTGKFREADLDRGMEPDLVIDSVDDLIAG